MIDEYQDTNDVQELIATLLSNGRNRFMVGDVKQSIYRFRQADPTIFQKKYRTFSSDENAEDRRIDLNRNFRSDSAILASINYIFRQLMVKSCWSSITAIEKRFIRGAMKTSVPLPTQAVQSKWN